MTTSTHPVEAPPHVGGKSTGGATTHAPPLLQARNISMAFGPVTVLRNVDFTLQAGEVHGLIGENGAGKSTLAKIIAGVHHARQGVIELDGSEVDIANPHEAIAMGIALIHQEPLTFPELDVAENIYIGRHPRKAGRVDWTTMYRRAREILDSLGVQLDPREKVRGLSIADQQMVEMAGALSQDARIILMDEPTASLTPNEVNRLFAIVRRLRSQGVAIVFVSHRLEEVLEICDRITVLRDGEVVGELETAETNVNEIIRLMVGRSLSSFYNKETSAPAGEVVLEVEGLTRAMKFEGISFQVRAGEIVGVAGLVGAGRTDVARAIFGTLDIDSGQVRLLGKPVRISHPRQALANGLIYLPEDRQHHGLLMPMSVTHNTTLSTLSVFTSGGWIRGARERRATSEYVQNLRIVLRSIDQPVRELSGGNQQKVVLSKWLLAKPRLMLLDEPTRGIDVGAKSEIYKLITELASQGIAILMISSELPEILGLSDRVLVMREGRIAAEFSRDEATAEAIMAAATGQTVTEEAAEVQAEVEADLHAAARVAGAAARAAAPRADARQGAHATPSATPDRQENAP